MRADRPSLRSSQEPALIPPTLQHLLPASSPLPSLSVEVDTIAQIHQAAVHGLKTLRRRGLEVGGILVGHWKPNEQTGPHVCVVRHVAVEIEYASGPRFVASARDLEKFRKQIEELQSGGDSVVGWWRSHTLDQNLSISETDIALSRELFPAIPAIALLLLPGLDGPTVATLHLASGEVIESSGPFSFERAFGETPTFAVAGSAADSPSPAEASPPVAQLPMDAPDPGSIAGSVSPMAGEERTEAPVVCQPPERAESPPPSDDILQPQPRTTAWRLSTFAVVAASMACVFLLLQAPRFGGRLLSSAEDARQRSVSAIKGLIPNHPSHNPSPADAEPSTAVASPADIELRVVWIRGGLQLEWDRQSPAIQMASEGKLEVQDGDLSRTVTLSAADLKSGAVTWFPSSEAVRFALSVKGEAGEAQGLLQAHGFRPDSRMSPVEVAGASGRPSPSSSHREAAVERSIRPTPSRPSRPTSSRPSRPTSSRTSRPTRDEAAAFREHSGASVGAVSGTQPGLQSDSESARQIAAVADSVPQKRPSPLISAPVGGRESSRIQAINVPQCRSTITAISYYEKRSRLGFLRALRKLPFVPGDGKPSEQPFVAPRAIEGSCPDLASAHLVKQPQWIDVVAEINRDGVVESATATGSSEHTYVAYRTVESVRSWRFQPATVADSSVDSEVRLRVFWSYPPSHSSAIPRHPVTSSLR
jgi:hypothetical protein